MLFLPWPICDGFYGGVFSWATTNLGSVFTERVFPYISQDNSGTRRFGIWSQKERSWRVPLSRTSMDLYLYQLLRWHLPSHLSKTCRIDSRCILLQLNDTCTTCSLEVWISFPSKHNRQDGLQFGGDLRYMGFHWLDKFHPAKSWRLCWYMSINVSFCWSTQRTSR